MKMYSYNEIQEFALSFNPHDYTKEQEQTLKDILHQLNYSWQDCHCKSLIGDLYTKLLSWCKRYKNGMPHYTIQRGIIFKCEGQLVCFATLTDELAELVREKMPQEFEKYIKEVLPTQEKEPQEQPQEQPTQELTNSAELDKKLEETKGKKEPSKRITKRTTKK